MDVKDTRDKREGQKPQKYILNGQVFKCSVPYLPPNSEDPYIPEEIKEPSPLFDPRDLTRPMFSLNSDAPEVVVEQPLLAIESRELLEKAVKGDPFKIKDRDADRPVVEAEPTHFYHLSEPKKPDINRVFEKLVEDRDVTMHFRNVSEKLQESFEDALQYTFKHILGKYENIYELEGTKYRLFTTKSGTVSTVDDGWTPHKPHQTAELGYHLILQKATHKEQEDGSFEIRFSQPRRIFTFKWFYFEENHIYFNGKHIDTKYKFVFESDEVHEIEFNGDLYTLSEKLLNEYITCRKDELFQVAQAIYVFLSYAKMVMDTYNLVKIKKTTLNYGIFVVEENGEEQIVYIGSDYEPYDDDIAKSYDMHAVLDATSGYLTLKNSEFFENIEELKEKARIGVSILNTLVEDDPSFIIPLTWLFSSFFWQHIVKRTRFYPLLGLVGPPQTGKSTFLSVVMSYMFNIERLSMEHLGGTGIRLKKLAGTNLPIFIDELDKFKDVYVPIMKQLTTSEAGSVEIPRFHFHKDVSFRFGRTVAFTSNYFTVDDPALRDRILFVSVTKRKTGTIEDLELENLRPLAGFFLYYLNEIFEKVVRPFDFTEYAKHGRQGIKRAVCELGLKIFLFLASKIDALSNCDSITPRVLDAVWSKVDSVETTVSTPEDIVRDTFVNAITKTTVNCRGTTITIHTLLAVIKDDNKFELFKQYLRNGFPDEDFGANKDVIGAVQLYEVLMTQKIFLTTNREVVLLPTSIKNITKISFQGEQLAEIFKGKYINWKKGDKPAWVLIKLERGRSISCAIVIPLEEFEKLIYGDYERMEQAEIQINILEGIDTKKYDTPEEMYRELSQVVLVDGRYYYRDKIEKYLEYYRELAELSESDDALYYVKELEAKIEEAKRSWDDVIFRTMEHHFGISQEDFERIKRKLTEGGKPGDDSETSDEELSEEVSDGEIPDEISEYEEYLKRKAEDIVNKDEFV